jgi:hypothetical protein
MWNVATLKAAVKQREIKVYPEVLGSYDVPIF